MTIFLIVLAAIAGLFFEIFCTYFTIQYFGWDINKPSDEANIICLSWWVWVFVIPFVITFALIKKPADWLVRKLS